MMDLQRLATMLLQAADAAVTVRRFIAFWGPLGDASAWLTPLVAVGSVLSLAILTGVAVGALVTLLITLMALYYLVSEIFGVSVDIRTSVPV